MSGAVVIAEPVPADQAAVADPLQLAAVEIWQASLDVPPAETVERLRALLSPDELRRAAAFRFERDRRRFAVARGILRTLLGDRLAREPRELTFVYGEHGKPTLKTEGGRPPLAFNVAHADGLAVFAFARGGDLGIDVERVRPIPEWSQIARAHFPPREVARLARHSPAPREMEFFKAWTRHEAILKAHGTGIGGHAMPEFASRVRVHAWEPAPGFVGALAVSPGACEFIFRTWPMSAGAFSAPLPGCGVQFDPLSESSPNLS